MLYLVHGNNPSLVYKKAKELMLSLSQGGESTIISLSDDNIDINVLSTRLSQVGMFNKSHVYLIKDCNDLKVSEWKNLLPFIYNSPHIIILSCSGKLLSFMSTKEFGKECNKRIEVNLKGKQGIRKIIAGSGLSLTHDAQKLLISKVGSNVGYLLQEIEKLSLLSVDTINKDIIEKYVSSIDHVEVWDLMRSIEQYDRSSIMKVYKRLRSAGIDIYFVFSMIVREYRLMYMVKRMLQLRYSFQAITKEVKLPYFVVSKLAKVPFSIERIKKIFSKLVLIDAQVKRGEIGMGLALAILFKLL